MHVHMLWNAQKGSPEIRHPYTGSYTEDYVIFRCVLWDPNFENVQTFRFEHACALDEEETASGRLTKLCGEITTKAFIVEAGVPVKIISL